MCKRVCAGCFVLVLLHGCALVQPRQVVATIVTSRPSVDGHKLAQAMKGASPWATSVDALKVGLEAWVLTQCYVCQFGYVAKQVGLVGGGVLSEALARAQTNEITAHRVAMPLPRGSSAPAVVTRREADGSTSILFLPAGLVTVEGGAMVPGKLAEAE